MARVIAVASAKGGVGKTTTTATLGTTLAATGARVVAVDADLGMANLGSALGVDADEATVHDVLAGRADADEAMYDGPGGLTVVPGDTDLTAFPDADPSNLRSLLGEFIDFDYVLLDTGAGLSHDTVLPLGLADDVLLVTNPDPNAVGDTEKTRQVVGRLGGAVAGAVVTRVAPERLGDETTDIADGLDAPVLATVPSSPLVTAAATTGEPVSLAAPTSDVAAAYRDLTRELTGEVIPEPDVDPEDDATESDADEKSDADESPDVDEEEKTVDEERADEEGDDETAAEDVAADDEGGDDEADGAGLDEADGAELDEDVADTIDAPDGAEDEADDQETIDSDSETDEATDAEADEEADEEADDESVAEADDSEDDVLVHDAENGEPVEDVDPSTPDEGDDSGVYETSLVEEAEASGASDDSDDESNDSDDDGGSGFLGRLLG